MTPEIDKVIEQLDAKIAALERARDTLVETFCPPDSPRRRKLTARLAPPALGSASVEEPEAGLPEGMRLRRKRTRKDIVAEFIRQYGPSTRAEILAGTGVPSGSVAFVLNDKTRFTLQNGRWRNVGEASTAVPLANREGPAGPEGTPTPVREPEPSQREPSV